MDFSTYALRHLPPLLCETGRADEAAELVGAEAFLRQKTALDGREAAAAMVEYVRGRCSPARAAGLGRRLLELAPPPLPPNEGLPDLPPVTSPFALAPALDRLAAGVRPDRIRIWDVDGTPVTQLEGLGEAATGVAFSPDGGRVAAGGEGGRLAVWRAETGSLVTAFQGPPERVEAIAFTEDGRALLTEFAGGSLRVHDPDTGAERACLWTRQVDEGRDAERLGAALAAMEHRLLAGPLLGQHPAHPGLPGLFAAVARENVVRRLHRFDFNRPTGGLRGTLELARRALPDEPDAALALALVQSAEKDWPALDRSVAGLRDLPLSEAGREVLWGLERRELEAFSAGLPDRIPGARWPAVAGAMDRLRGRFAADPVFQVAVCRAVAALAREETSGSPWLRRGAPLFHEARHAYRRRPEARTPELDAALRVSEQPLRDAGQLDPEPEEAPELSIGGVLRQAAGLDRAGRQRVVLEDIRRRWSRGERVVVEDYRQRQPEMALSLVRGLVHAEAGLRREAGDSVGATFERRFPELVEPRPADSATAPGTIVRPPESRILQEIPEEVAGFAVSGLLGEGGMGAVYAATDLGLGREVAIKFQRYGRLHQEARFRLQTEAKAIARLNHPNICAIYGSGWSGDQFFLVMERLTGGSLMDRISRGPLDPLFAARAVAAVADGVEFGHSNGVIHRDIKPHNILFDTAGTPKIIDYGLARLEEQSRITQAGMAMGTPGYMSPEQAMGDLDVGPGTDIYGLGATLYACLTGAPPFRQIEGNRERVRATIELAPPPVRQLRPDLPRDLDTVCMRCLEKDPARRYPSAAALATDLRRFLAAEPIAARPVGRFERLWTAARRRPLLVAFAAVTAALGLGAVATIAWLANENAALRRMLEGPPP